MTTTPHAVTTQSTPARTKRRLRAAKPITGALVAAGLLLGGAGVAGANTGGYTSTSSISRTTTLTIDPNVVHPASRLIRHRTVRIDPTVVKTDCLYDPGAGLFRCP